MILSRSEIEDRARAMFGEPNRRLSTRSELRYGKKGSISVRLDGEKAGLWFDFEADKGGTLLKREDMPDGYQRPAPRQAVTHDSESSGQLARTLRNLAPVHGTPAEVYLLRRGITRWPEHSIRFCFQPYGLCGLSQDASGAIRACQIVYLTDDGRKRSDLPVKKRTYTACSGWHEVSAVRLPGRGEPILCEGIETGLSIWCSLEPQRPVHACLGQAGLRALRIRSPRLTIARDGDEPDSKADIALQRAIGARRSRQRVRVASPPVGLDFNDVLLRSGAAEVARLIRDAR